MNKYFIFLILCILSNNVIGQNNREAINFEVGLTTIPLIVNRTNAVRWMVFPSFKGSIRISDQFSISGSYLFHDIRQGKYSGDDPFIYSETPSLKTYEMALNHIGSRFGNSEFSNYIFMGVNFHWIDHGAFKMDVGSQIGLRFGATFLLSHVIENSSRPNGFEVHSTIFRSTGPGLNVSLFPRLQLTETVSINASIGVYAFHKWPVVQNYAGVSMGIAF